MGQLLAQLIPIAIVGALAPLPLMVIVTLLMSETRGLLKACCFGGAVLAVYAVIGAITFAFGSGNSTSTENTAVTGTITAVLGALFVLMAIKHDLGQRESASTGWQPPEGAVDAKKAYSPFGSV